MNTTELAELFTTFYPTEFLKHKLDDAVRFFPEDVEHVLPSIQLGQDGLSLSSLLLVTKNYLCELRLNEAKTVSEYDFVAKNSIFNYRIKTWVHEIIEDGNVSASFEIAEVNLSHGSSAGFKTQLSFAGNVDGREAWLKDLTQNIPIKLVLGFSHLID